MNHTLTIFLISIFIISCNSNKKQNDLDFLGTWESTGEFEFINNEKTYNDTLNKYYLRLNTNGDFESFTEYNNKLIRGTFTTNKGEINFSSVPCIYTNPDLHVTSQIETKNSFLKLTINQIFKKKTTTTHIIFKRTQSELSLKNLVKNEFPNQIITSLNIHLSHYYDTFDKVYNQSNCSEKLEVKENIDTLLSLLKEQINDTYNHCYGVDISGQHMACPYFRVSENYINDTFIEDAKPYFEFLKKKDPTEQFKMNFGNKHGTRNVLLSNYEMVTRTYSSKKGSTFYDFQDQPQSEIIYGYEVVAGLINLRCEVLKMGTNILLQK